MIGSDVPEGDATTTTSACSSPTFPICTAERLENEFVLRTGIEVVPAVTLALMYELRVCGRFAKLFSTDISMYQFCPLIQNATSICVDNAIILLFYYIFGTDYINNIIISRYNLYNFALRLKLFHLRHLVLDLLLIHLLHSLYILIYIQVE